MSKKIPEGFLIVLAFALLWIPFGQQSFLYEHWMKLGIFMMPFLAFLAISFEPNFGSIQRPDPKLIALFLLCIYIVHQFEEHWVDLYGNNYAFQGSINELVKMITGSQSEREGPLSAEAIFVINTSLVWLVGTIAIMAAPQNVFPTLAMTAITFTNGIVHIASAIAQLAYNPGLLTSLILFLPMSWIAFRVIPARRSLKLLALAWAALAHILMALGMMASTWWGVISPQIFYASLIAWSLLPLLHAYPSRTVT